MGKAIVEDSSACKELETTPWHTLSKEASIAKLNLGTDLRKTGLTTADAKSRLETYGPNKMTEAERETIWQKIWKQVANVLVTILVLVAAVSAARALVEQAKSDDDPSKSSTTILTSWIQVGLITGVITINTAIGILQEGSAEKAAEALKNMLSSDARVIRDGREQMIPGVEVVPGEVIILSLGDRIPADMRMLEVSNLACSEAALTGESVPIDKIISIIQVPEGVNPFQTPLGDRCNMTFSATLVAQGSATGMAIATGDYTQIGTINKLVSQTEKKKTNVLEQIDQVSKILAVMIGLATFATYLVAWLKGKQDQFAAVSTALVCCVAMVPEGLEAIVTLTYAWAVTNMAKKNAIIRALPAVETLGSVTVICSDKTGTLTQNIMSLAAFVTSNARYKFDVNSADRVPENFLRDDSFMAERAQHAKNKSVKDVVADGGTNSGKKLGRVQSNPYLVDTSMHGASDDESAASKNNSNANYDSQNIPFANGDSPNAPFVEDMLKSGVLCSKCVLGENGQREGSIGNPTELSILRAAYFSGMEIDDLKTKSPFVAEVPFSSEYKFMATIHNEGKSGSYTVYAKGAPDRMVKFCKTQARAGQVDQLEPNDEKYWIEQIAVLSSHGLRVLALTKATIPSSQVEMGANLGPEFINGKGKWLTMIGLCAIIDPPRPECVDAIKLAHGAGVRVAMITGDHKDTATAIGQMLGLVDETYSEAVTGPEMDEMSDEQVKEAVMTHNVFARASPSNKITIVKALQAQGQISSMTGDGVNDAPALKAADMGVAMGLEGTDVAREASEMILADDNFATIVTAVREGRVVWDNLRKVLLVNTPINNAQGMSVLFGLLFGLRESPLSPIQVLYSNLICAITLGFVCAIEPAEQGIMDLPPRRIGKRLIGRYLLLRILLGTMVLTSLVVASAFWLISFNSDDCDDIYGWGETADPNCTYNILDVHALSFNVLDFGAISITLSARFAYNSSISINVFKNNKYCWYSIFIVAGLQLFLTYTPGVNEWIFQMRGMDGIQWGIVFLFMTVVFLVMEAEKGIRRVLKRAGEDTDDAEFNPAFDVEEEPDTNQKLLPSGGSKLNLVSLDK